MQPAPLVATDDAVQREIVAELARWRPPFVVLVDMPPSTEPNASSRTFPVHELDDAIARDYEVVLEGPYRVLARRPGR